MQLNKSSKIFITGHKGMVGSSIVRVLKKKGYKNLINKQFKIRFIKSRKTYNFLKK